MSHRLEIEWKSSPRTETLRGDLQVPHDLGETVRRKFVVVFAVVTVSDRDGDCGSWPLSPVRSDRNLDVTLVSLCSLGSLAPLRMWRLAAVADVADVRRPCSPYLVVGPCQALIPLICAHFLRHCSFGCDARFSRAVFKFWGASQMLMVVAVRNSPSPRSGRLLQTRGFVSYPVRESALPSQVETQSVFVGATWFPMCLDVVGLLELFFLYVSDRQSCDCHWRGLHFSLVFTSEYDVFSCVQ